MEGVEEEMTIDEQIKKLLEEGITEAEESDEFTKSTKAGLPQGGLSDNKRKSQLKNLQSGTEKIMKALWLKRNKNISKGVGRTISLGDIIQELEQGGVDIIKEEIETLKEINKANMIKHGTNYRTEEILNVRNLLNKIIGLVKNE